MSGESIPDPIETERPDLPDWLDPAAGDVARDRPAPVQQKFSTFSVSAVIVSVALLIVIGYALYQRSLSQPTAGPAPLFEVTVFDYERLDYAGETLKLADLKGNVVVINFWASYCQSCKKEARMLEAVYRENKARGVIFLGINTDDIESEALKYLDDYDITYPNAPDMGGLIEDQYRITGIPETFVVDAKGEITDHFIAAVDEDDLRDAIADALES